ncbi:hypothetical protein ADN00_11865 [Ornatilinea apprima]|uniref:N-acetyltransferase domain-containing protein n=1 Tax=Ornatilinea apprima TaxID=1134406 RepID=A0A0P6X6U8_9CHLR|nr:N-acetyltransferase [Ornatilinea apprima]KPL76045.1 hypothetical protein ADN00_11865 [Ornatilinea apprima]
MMGSDDPAGFEEEGLSAHRLPRFWNPRTKTYTVRQATPLDEDDLSILLSVGFYVHRHLDWRSASHWLSHQPFYVLEEDGFIQAALACPPDLPGMAWVRLYATNSPFDARQAWEALFPPVLEALQAEKGFTLAALSLHEWFSSLLLHTGFQHHHNIIVLEWTRRALHPTALPPHVSIQPMTEEDLQTVCEVDHRAFDRLWRISADEIAHAYLQSAYASVLKCHSQIIAYQISTRTGSHAHLARLAVLPEFQHQGLATRMLEDLLTEFTRRRVRTISVNTQHTNHASIALYKKAGFVLTGESFPVYVYPT